MLRKCLIATTSVLSLAAMEAHAENIRVNLAGLPFAYDTEFYRNWANNVVKADRAHLRGYTGSGQTVSVFDTGIAFNHPEFAGRIVTGFDAVLNRTGTPRDVAWHGTFVAGVIAAARDGVGMQGIAYNANILAVRIANADGSITLSDSRLANGIQYARTRSGVQNHSWNSSATILDVTRAQVENAYGLSITQWRNSVNLNNNVVVWAAGNEGKSEVGFFGGLPRFYSDLLKGWIVTVATDKTGSIASYSNRCGVSAAWCLAAPGSEILSTNSAGGYGVASGTSFAAPVVAGGAALLRQMWPFLSNTDIVNILFTTANKSGIYANSAIYGQGLLDLEAATRPVGTTGIATGSTVAATTATSETLTATSSAFGASLGSIGITGGPNVMVLDSFNRDFHVPVGTFVAPAAMSYDMERNIRHIGGGLLSIGDEDGIHYNVAAYQGVAENGLPRFSMSFSAGEGHRVSVATGLNAQHLFGGAAASLDAAGILAKGDQVGSAYLGLAGNDSWSGAWSTRFGATSFSVAAINGNQADTPTEWQRNLDPYQKISRADVSGMAVRSATNVGSAKLAFQAGHVIEARTVLGSASEGAFALGDGAATSFAGFSFEVPLMAGLAAFGGAEVGHSDVQARNGSLITGLSGVVSSAFHAGVATGNLFSDGDRLGFVVSQPMRVESGRATMNLPTARDMDGNVMYDAHVQSLVPDGREIDVQLGYATNLSDDASLALSGLLRMQPDNIRTAPAEGVFMASYRLRF